MSITNKPLDDLEAEINEALAAATPGPWIVSDSRSNWWSIKSATAKYRDPMGAYETPACVLLASQNMAGAWRLSHLPNPADERLIANTPRYLAALLSEVRRLRTELHASAEGHTAQFEKAVRLKRALAGRELARNEASMYADAISRHHEHRMREQRRADKAERERDEARAFADDRVDQIVISERESNNRKHLIDEVRAALDVPTRGSLLEHVRATVMALQTERERAEKAERDSVVLRGELMKWHDDRWHNPCLRKETDLRERAEKAERERDAIMDSHAALAEATKRAEKAEADLADEKKHYAAVQEQWKKECAERHEQARQAHEAEQLVKKQVGAIERLSSDLSVCRKALEEREVLQNERDAAMQEVARLKEPMEGWVRIKSIEDDRAQLGQMHREAQERAEKAEAEVARLRKDAAHHGYNA